MPYQIEIQNTAGRRKVPQKKLKRIAAQILKSLGWKQAGLSVLLVSDRKIRVYNKRYLRHDRPTDVIAFGYGNGQGDLIISLDTTARQAVEYGNSFFYELCFYLCHGILHLMGYDDHTAKEARRMEKKQAAILKKIGVRQSA